jgi:hypothetical protein
MDTAEVGMSFKVPAVQERPADNDCVTVTVTFPGSTVGLSMGPLTKVDAERVRFLIDKAWTRSLELFADSAWTLFQNVTVKGEIR